MKKIFLGIFMAGAMLVNSQNPVTSGLFMDLDPINFVPGTGWPAPAVRNDASGNGNNVTVIGTAHSPCTGGTVTISTANPVPVTASGFGAVKFNGTSLMQGAATTAFGTDATIFVVTAEVNYPHVSNPVAGNGYSSISISRTDSGNCVSDEFCIVNNGVYHHSKPSYWVGRQVTCEDIDSGQLVVQCGSWGAGITTADMDLYVDGNISSNAFSTLNTPVAFTAATRQVAIGARYYNNVPADPCPGIYQPISETFFRFLVYNRRLSSSEIAQVNAYLMNKYSVVASACILDSNNTLNGCNSACDWQLNGNAIAGTSNILGTLNSSDVRFVTNSAERMRMLSTGNIGIGNSAPNAALHVGTNTTTGSDLIVGYDISNKNYYTTNGGTVLTDSKIVADMKNAGGAAGILIKGGADPASNTFFSPVIGFSGTNTTLPHAKDILGASIAGSIISNTAGSEQMDLLFLTQSGGTALSEKMRVTGTGNVGIGTNSPSAQLHTTGTVRVAGVAAQSQGSDTKFLTIDATGNVHWNTVGLTSSCSTANYLPKSTGAGTMSCSEIYDNGTQIGIGTTSPTSLFQVSGSTTLGDYGNQNYARTQGGTVLSDSRLTVIQSSTGGSAGLLIKGGTNTPNMGFSFRNTSSWDILGAGIAAVPTNTTAGSEVMDLYFQTQSGGTASSEKVRITGAGSLCVATTSPRTYSGTGTSLGTPPANGTVAKLDVNGLAFANSMVVSSDSRFKKNIVPIQDALSVVSKLTGVSYDWNQEANKDRNFDNFRQAGFIAQDVEKVYPIAVLTDDQGYYAMNYNAMLPLFAEAIKELNAKTASIPAAKNDSVSILRSALDNTNATVATLQKQLDDLCNGGCASFNTSNDRSPVNTLMQNVPNPFSKTTSIAYVINVGSSAYININGMDGKLIKHVNVSVNGPGSISIGANEMSAGTYTYTLTVDEKIVDTKLMVITSTN